MYNYPCSLTEEEENKALDEMRRYGVSI